VADNDGDLDEARVLRPPQATACTYGIAFGPQGGQKVLTLQGVMPRDADGRESQLPEARKHRAPDHRTTRPAGGRAAARE
jgi:hypothetical protein